MGKTFYFILFTKFPKTQQKRWNLVLIIGKLESSDISFIFQLVMLSL